MKRFLLITMIIFSVNFYFYSWQEITVLSVRNNLPMLKGVKPIYILPTFNGTLIYKVPIDKFIKGINDKKINVLKLTKEGLIKKYINALKDITNFRKYWRMRVIDDWSQAKKGFVMVLNYDYDNPEPPFGAKGQATGAIYKIGQKKPIITFRIKCYRDEWEYGRNFANMADSFLQSLYFDFIIHINNSAFNLIK